MRRPILAVVLNSLIVIAGLAAIFGVEVRELPDVDRPVITVTTDYDGAAPETIDREVTGVIEGAMGRISGVSGDLVALVVRPQPGDRRVQRLDRPQRRRLRTPATPIGRVLNQLPDDADEPRIVKADANSDAVIRIGVTSDTMTVEDLTELVEEHGRGPADRRPPASPTCRSTAAASGSSGSTSTRSALASRGLTVADVRDALGTVAFDSRPGR